MERRPVTVFFKLGALGDTIMTTPALRAYRKSFPHVEIIYVVGKTCESALSGNPNIDRLITFDDDPIYYGGKISRIKMFFNVIKLLKSLKADKIFVMQKDDKWNYAAEKAGIAEKYGFSAKPSKSLDYFFDQPENMHEIDSYINLCLLEKGCKPDGQRLNLYNGEHEPERVLGLTGNLFRKTVIAIAPGGRSGLKAEDDLRRWGGYLELIKIILEKTDCNILVIGSRSDKKLLDTSTIEGERLLNICGKIPVGGSLVALKKSDLLISNDGGAMIIGAAAEIPVISIFGPTNPKGRQPLSNKLSRYIWLEKDCSPCIKNSSFPKKTDHSCMNDITPEAVLKEIQDVLSQLK